MAGWPGWADRWLDRGRPGTRLCHRCPHHAARERSGDGGPPRTGGHGPGGAHRRRNHPLRAALPDTPGNIHSPVQAPVIPIWGQRPRPVGRRETAPTRSPAGRRLSIPRFGSPRPGRSHPTPADRRCGWSRRSSPQSPSHPYCCRICLSMGSGAGCPGAGWSGCVDLCCPAIGPALRTGLRPVLGRSAAKRHYQVLLFARPGWLGRLPVGRLTGWWTIILVHEHDSAVRSEGPTLRDR